MKLNFNISIDVTPDELKQLIKITKKLGAAELMQQAMSAATVQPAPTAPEELPAGTFDGPCQEEGVSEKDASTPAKRGRKKSTLGFRG